MSSASSDPVDAIAVAIARLRGQRRPRPPWDGSPHEHVFDAGDPDWTHGGHHGGHPAGHRSGHHGGRRGGPWGPPPWVAGARFGGPARMRLLEALASAPGSLSVSELGDAVGVDQPRASRLVQQAAELGLVRREADPNDARRTRIALTDEGRRIVAGFRGERRDAVDTALAGFTDAERGELARLLTKLAAAWPID
ncbi:MarR family winged helix-turn-helix transcriptional regulator [Microbacterium sp. AZCO]|uniref:MarR family winged helix-turn-helix transcriptional regulator n=1 Tax=Microbacterium sp. AZCO TaxID=3142976 RepID=UPI0031F45C49